MNDIQVYDVIMTIGANINEQVSIEGYGDYLWTIHIQEYLGDTILHLAIKLMKRKCINYLLLHPSMDFSIENVKNQTVEDLLSSIDNSHQDFMSLRYLKSNSYHELVLSARDPMKYEEIVPVGCRHPSVLTRRLQGIHEEARSFAMRLKTPRILYNQRDHYIESHPCVRDAIQTRKSLKNHDMTTSRVKIDHIKPHWRRRYDSNDITTYLSSYPVQFNQNDINDSPKVYLYNIHTHERRDMTSDEIKHGFWDEIFDPKSSKTFYVNEVLYSSYCYCC